MNTHRWLAIVLAPSLLAGCNAIGMKGSPMWHKTASNDVKREHFESICRAYGYRAGTDEMVDCIQTEWRASGAKSTAWAQRLSDRNSSSEEGVEERLRKLERNESSRRTKCIQTGGVWVSGTCR